MNERLGTCDAHKKLHEHYMNCKNWQPMEENPEVNAVCQVESRLGVWVNGKFHPVDLGALGVLISDKDAEIEELSQWKSAAIKTTPDMQEVGNLLDMKWGEGISHNLIPSIKTLKFRLQHQEDLVQVLEKCVRDAKTQLLEQEYFGVSCVCKFKGGKVTSLCAAHQTVVDETRDRIHAQYKMLHEELQKGYREA